MIIFDIILGVADWIRLKIRGSDEVLYWWPRANTLKCCIKTRIIERRLKKY